MRLVACIAALATLTAVLPVAAQARTPPIAISKSTTDSSGPSVLALYLAGNAALGEGRYDDATNYFASATLLAKGEAHDSLQELAFQSALEAGDVARAALLAPQSEGASQSARQLGQLVIAVDAMATGDNHKASTLFAGSTMGLQFRPVAALLKPWAAAADGDKSQITTTLPARADAVTRISTNYNTALLQEVTGQYDQIDSTYKDLITRGPDFLELQYMYSYAAFLERRGRPAEAVQIYDNILQSSPDNQRAMEARDRASAKHPRALPALTAKQGAAQILVTQGMISLASNDPDTALYYFWLALRLDDKRTDAMFLAGSIEASTGANVSARSHLDKIPRNAPEYIDARISIAETWLSDHDNAKALSIARETTSRAPRDLSAKTSLGSILAIAGKNHEAVDAFTQVIRARGDDASWGLYYNRATSYNDLDDWAHAELDLKKALELSPDQPEVMNYLGFMWADKSEHLDEALTLLQKAARARPNEGAIVDSLGWVYYRMGDIPKAIENLERATEMDAADPSVNDHLGDAYLSAGRQLEAVYQWQRVLSLHPDDKLKSQVERKIATHQASATVASVRPPTADTP